MKKCSKVLVGLGSIATIAGAATLIYKAVEKKKIGDLLYEPEMPDKMKYSKNNFITELQAQGILLYMDYPEYDGVGKNRKVVDAVSYYLDQDNNNLGACFCRVYSDAEAGMYEASLEIDGMTYGCICDSEDEAYEWLYKAVFEAEDEDDIWENECEDA